MDKGEGVMDEKTKEALENIKDLIGLYGPLSKAYDKALAHLQAMAEANAALKADLARCEENYAQALRLASTYKETAERSGAELTQKTKDYNWMMAQHDMWKACAFKEAELKDGLRAELKLAEGTIGEITKAWCLGRGELSSLRREADAARPLLEAIACLKGLDVEELDWPTISIRYNAEDYYWHIRAAKEKA